MHPPTEKKVGWGVAYIGNIPYLCFVIIVNHLRLAHRGFQKVPKVAGQKKMVEQEILTDLIGPITNPEFEPQPEPDYGPDCSGPDVNPRED